MVKSKFRKHKKVVRPEKVVPLPVKQEKRQVFRGVSKSAKITLTDEDQVIYVYEIDAAREVSEVVNVSYQILINGSWVTILRFDSEHGFLHGHRRISSGDEREIVFTAGVKRKGTPHRWLTWSVDYIKKNYLNYKRAFLKRSRGFDKVG